MFKVCGIIGISKIEFFNFSFTERVKNVNKFRKQKAEILVIKKDSELRVEIVIQ